MESPQQQQQRTHAGRLTTQDEAFLTPRRGPASSFLDTLEACAPPVWLSWPLALLTALPASAQRLPTIVTPAHYDLAFVVDLARERFEGTETIRVQVAEPTPQVVLNAVEIEFREVTIGSRRRGADGRR